MSILIKDIQLDGKTTDVLIEQNRISRIAEVIDVQTDQVIDGKGKALIPGFVNAHTHAAMTLFRGYGDDRPLMDWLKNKIWPAEAKLTDEDLYWGTKLACLEMIKTGTTAFVDMYFKPLIAAEVVEEMGLRVLLSGSLWDHFDDKIAEKGKHECEMLYDSISRYSDRIRYAVGPHAIYTVSGKLLRWVNDFANERDLLIHMHVAETQTEVDDAKKLYGLTPVRYLNQLGLLTPRLIMAHGIYIEDDEIQLLADNGVKVVYNPASNMKLASGMTFKLDEMRKAGVTVALGTDGCASSNNLDMVEAMKLASLIGKVWRKDPEAVRAETIYNVATRGGTEAIGLDAGRVEVGALADLCLVNLQQPAFTPNHNFISNLVYSANGSAIDTVICDGRVLMENGRVPGEEKILKEASMCATRLVERANRKI